MYILPYIYYIHILKYTIYALNIYYIHCIYTGYIQVGGCTIVGKLVDGLKDESEPYRKMVMETIEKVATNSFFGGRIFSPRVSDALRRYCL